MLWVCLAFPDLPLQVFAGMRDGAEPSVVWDASAGARVHAANDAARVCGITPGMMLSAAHALSPTLQARARDEALERSALEGIAAWSIQFTPRVTLFPPTSVLLEVAGSLRYFAGLDRLLQRIRQGLAEMGCAAAMAVAPTAAAARLLARAGREEPVLEQGALEAALAPLPTRLLEGPPAWHDALSGMGVSRLRDCFALPRAGLARRFGQALVDHLDDLLGRRTEICVPFPVPERFTAQLPLIVPVSGGEALLFGARRLLQQLCGWLVGRGLGTTRWQLNLAHERLAATAVQIGCMPSRDPAHLLLLLREHLARRALAAPVEALTLEVLETCPVEPRTRALLDDEAHRRASIGSLLDRLGARLGPEAATVLSLRDEHRPERAWGPGRPAASATAPGHVAGPRPLWLLPEPQPIRLSAGQPVLEGPLDLLSGPERIESGWWDGADVARDYYVAVHEEGLRLWVFRDLRGAGWYLHGVFG